MSRLDEWEGTEEEVQNTVEALMLEIKLAEFDDMDEVEFRKLFCESFSQHVLQNDLKNIMHRVNGDYREGA